MNGRRAHFTKDIDGNTVVSWTQPRDEEPAGEWHARSTDGPSLVRYFFWLSVLAIIFYGAASTETVQKVVALWKM